MTRFFLITAFAIAGAVLLQQVVQLRDAEAAVQPASVRAPAVHAPVQPSPISSLPEPWEPLDEFPITPVESAGAPMYGV